MNDTPAPEPEDSPTPRAPRILLVDDDDNYRVSIQQLLEGLGYSVLTVASGLKALNLFNILRDEIDIVVLDYLMPDMDGEETLRRLRQIRPDVKIIVISGAEELRLRRVFHAQPIAGYLRKPVLSRDIHTAFQRALITSAEPHLNS